MEPHPSGATFEFQPQQQVVKATKTQSLEAHEMELSFPILYEIPWWQFNALKISSPLKKTLAE
jgi:hypothetical protein